ncbi:response regulator [Paracnuella aquatica]|uniref:response regulator n=1 Tax=Paracnuella aquatica TaxID=2268757 RepID=UPI000DEED256|nr:response regulator [Paracnuella aquatica]RPD51539.1 response regulator [Paracnuella aquatica]
MHKKLKSVLLIDDDEPTNFINAMVLEELDCAESVQVAQSGAEAIELLHTASDDAAQPVGPDLIFLDINMPAMNGWEFLEQYRQLPQNNKGKVMVVMLTTSLFPEDQHRAMEIPEVAGFENKPLTKEKVERILQEYFAN